MAAAVIPILAAATPILRPLIKGLIGQVQRIFGHNNGTGTTKAQTVIDATLAVVDKLSTAGKIPGQLDAATIASLVEAIVQEMKSTGELPADGQIPVQIGTNALGTSPLPPTFHFEGSLRLKP